LLLAAGVMVADLMNNCVMRVVSQAVGLGAIQLPPPNQTGLQPAYSLELNLGVQRFQKDDRQRPGIVRDQ